MKKALVLHQVLNSLVPRAGVSVGTRGFRGIMKDLGKVKKPRIKQPILNSLIIINGGPGSGHHGHKGNPGQRGGSVARDAASASTRTVTQTMARISRGELTGDTAELAERRAKHHYSTTAKKAEVWDSISEDLEHKLVDGRKLPLSTGNLKKLYEAHAAAADNFRNTVLQGTATRESTVEEQKERYKKAEQHQDLADRYMKKLKSRDAWKEGFKSTAIALGRGAATAAVLATGGMAGESLKGRLGEVAGDIAMQAIIGGGKAAIAQRDRRVMEKADLDKYVHSKERTGSDDLLKPLPGRELGSTKSDLEAAEALIRRAGGGPLTSKQRAEWSKDMPGPEEGDAPRSSRMAGTKILMRKPTSQEARAKVVQAMKVAGARRFKDYRDLATRPKGDLRDEAARRTTKETIGQAVSRHKKTLEDLHDLGISSRGTVLKGKTEGGAAKPRRTVAEESKLAAAMEVAGVDDATLIKALTGNKLTVNFTTVTANLTNSVRRETLQGRDYLVAPLTMIVPGVLAGSKGPLLYPEEEVKKNPTAWNGMPIVVNHPMVNGIPVEARSPGVLDRQQIGTVFNARYKGKLVAEGWFDVDRTRKTNIGIYEQLINNKPIELSTGLYTDNEPYRGVWNGREYHYVARNYRPDHLAILIGSRGACSVKDGCGVLINATAIDELKGHASRLVQKKIGTRGAAQKIHGFKKGRLTKTAHKVGQVQDRIVGNPIAYNEFKLVRNKLVHPRVRMTVNVIALNEGIDKQALKKKLKKTAQFTGGAALGGVGTMGAGKAGAIGGAKLGGKIGLLGGPKGALIGAGLGGLIGGGVGMATGGYAAKRAATAMGGRTAGIGSDVGGTVGLIAGGGLGFKAAQAAKAAQGVKAGITAKGVAKGLGKAGVSIGATEGTGVALKKAFGGEGRATVVSKSIEALKDEHGAQAKPQPVAIPRKVNLQTRALRRVPMGVAR